LLLSLFSTFANLTIAIKSIYLRMQPIDK